MVSETTHATHGKTPSLPPRRVTSIPGDCCILCSLPPLCPPADALAPPMPPFLGFPRSASDPCQAGIIHLWGYARPGGFPIASGDHPPVVLEDTNPHSSPWILAKTPLPKSRDEGVTRPEHSTCSPGLSDWPLSVAAAALTADQQGAEKWEGARPLTMWEFLT